MHEAPIHPQVEERNKEADIHWRGLTKREWFAGLAMQGICANPEFLSKHKEIDIEKAAFKIADGMIKESQIY